MLMFWDMWYLLKKHCTDDIYPLLIVTCSHLRFVSYCDWLHLITTSTPSLFIAVFCVDISTFIVFLLLSSIFVKTFQLSSLCTVLVPKIRRSRRWGELMELSLRRCSLNIFFPLSQFSSFGISVGIHDSVWLALLFLEFSLFFMSLTQSSIKKFTILISFLQTPDEKGSQQRSKEVTKDDNALLYSIDETPPLYLSFLLGFQVSDVHLSYTNFFMNKLWVLTKVK